MFFYLESEASNGAAQIAAPAGTTQKVTNTTAVLKLFYSILADVFNGNKTITEKKFLLAVSIP